MMLSLRPLCPVIVNNESTRANANNSPFRVVVYPGGDAAVLAQELREYGLRWMIAFPVVLAAISLAVLHANGWNVIEPAIGVFVAFCVALLIPALPPVKRWMELHGHECEVQAAVALYGAAETDYRYNEARGMQRGYDGIFKDWTIEQVETAMAKRADRSRGYVKARMGFLRRFKAEVR